MFDVPWSGGNEVLLATLTEVGLSKRLVKSMSQSGIDLLGQFVQLEPNDILRKQGLGWKSYHEAKAILETLKLSFGMTLTGWDDDLAYDARKAMGKNIHKRIFELRPTAWRAHETLEDELLALLREVEDERNAQMLMVFFGFNEAGPQTLEFSGQPYGLTRERVRQIVARAEKKIGELWRPMRCVERIETILKTQLQMPFTNGDFTGAVKAAGISRINFHVEGALSALQLLGLRHSITRVRISDVDIFGTNDSISTPKKILTELRKETSSSGCTNIQRLSLLIGGRIEDALHVRELLGLFNEVKWLDDDRTWLLSKRSTRNRLANIAARVFQVAQSVDIYELRAALRRHVRVNFVPPVTALAELMQHYGIATVRSGVATVDANLEHTDIGINDMGFISAFKEIGSPATREQLEDYCIDTLGMNINSFYVYLTYSPFVTKLATGVFALVGQDVSPGSISQLKEDISSSRFEETFGWSKAGTLWWHFQADRPTAKAGTRAVPTFVYSLTSGDWSVRTFDGLDAGKARIDNGYLLGLRAAFVALGVANKDFLQLDFDIANREVFVRLTGDEPEEFSRKLESDEFDDGASLEDGN